MDFFLHHPRTLVEQALNELRFGEGPLPSKWLWSKHGHAVALWLDLCRCVMVQDGRLLPQAELAKLRALITSPQLRFDRQPAETIPCPPHRVAELARYVYGSEGWCETDRPESPQEELVCAALQPVPDLPRPAIDLTQLLVIPESVGLEDSGALGRLLLWRHPARRPEDDGELVRAPGAAFLEVDARFQNGLDAARQLVKQVVAPSGQFLAWDLRPLERSGKDAHGRSLRAVGGPSASAAFAYAALHALRHHLRDDFARQRAQLLDTDPTHLTITAELAQPPSADDGRWRWPVLSPIGGIDDKLGAFNNLPTGRERGSCYVATGQTFNAALPDAVPVASLDKLIEQASRDNGSGLSEDAQRLHDLLVADNEPIDPGHAKLLNTVAAQPGAGSIKAHLVWRYALRACGQLRPFGEPMALDRHFVRLQLAPERDELDGPESAPAKATQVTLRKPPDRRPEIGDLAQLLQGKDYADIPAFLIQGGPFAGKTTLLAQYEMATARAALQNHQRTGQWGEVCVFLPMRGFAAAWKAHEGRAEAALAAFFAECAPGLPALQDIFAAKPIAQGLQCRLLLDALNEITAASVAERQAMMRGVCDWLARAGRSATPAGPLLAPVFSVRERENGISLASVLQPTWRARTAHVLAWRMAEMHGYVRARELPAQAHDKLVEALGEPDAEGQPRTDFGRFCATPGILAAQCTLLKQNPGMALLRQRGQLLLAVFWHALLRICEAGDVPETMVPEGLRFELTQLRHRSDWLLPDSAEERGVLIQQLAEQADAMQDSQGGSAEQVLLSTTPPGLLKPSDRQLRETWLRLVREMGLALTDSRYFAFSHQQWQELFSALGLPEQPGQALTPLPLSPPDEDGLRALLKTKDGRLTLPPQHPQTERVLLALDLGGEAAACRRIRNLLAVNLPLAARCAIAARERLEPDRWASPHPLLQHVRRLLLLRSVDAGAAVKERVLASGVGHSLALTERDDDVGLRAEWDVTWKQAFKGHGHDIRHRIQTGLLLGELGDTLRYEKVAGHGGLRLKPWHWIGTGPQVQECLRTGVAAPKQTFVIGDARGGDKEQPIELEMEGFAMAAYPVTVGEWQAFMEDPGCYDRQSPWWQAAGQAARDWLEQQPDQGRSRRPWALDQPAYNNPLQPMTGITWFEAEAYCRWARTMVDGPAPPRAGSPCWKLKMPTEIQWEAGVRGAKSTRWGRWPHEEGGAEPDALSFNHQATGWRYPSPVGVFSAGYASHGVADAAGNVSEWCATIGHQRYDRNQLYDRTKGHEAGGPLRADSDPNAPRALRGGVCNGTAYEARVGYRHFVDPGYVDDGDLGLRLVRVWLPHL